MNLNSDNIEVMNYVMQMKLSSKILNHFFSR